MSDDRCKVGDTCHHEEWCRANGQCHRASTPLVGDGELPARLLAEQVDGGCDFAGLGRGDCEHFVGLPGRSIPGQHDGPDDTVDHCGKPNGWCWSCWKSHQLEVLRAAAPAWQPIATAPKDGTPMLLAVGNRVSYGGWHSDIDHGAEWEGQIGMAGWWVVDSLGEADPTHWMPLPAAPTPTGEPS